MYLIDKKEKEQKECVFCIIGVRLQKSWASEFQLNPIATYEHVNSMKKEDKTFCTKYLETLMILLMILYFLFFLFSYDKVYNNYTLTCCACRECE